MDDDIFYHADPDDFNQQISTRQSVKSKLLYLAVRMPPILAADMILFHNDFLTAKLAAKLDTYFYTFLIFLITKLFTLLALLFCLQIFTIKFRYAVNIYKIIFLLTITLTFKHFCEVICNFSTNSVFQVCLVYSLAFTATTLLYADIYANLIADKNCVQERYRVERNHGSEEAIDDYLETLLSHDTSPTISEINLRIEQSAIDEILAVVRRRRMYLLLVFLLGLLFNEIMSKSANIISMGCLIIFSVDVITNLDQLTLRLLIKIKYLGNLVNEFGFNNLITFNWFQRLQVPHMLRMFFLFKCCVFTLNFALFYPDYVRLDYEIELQNSIKQNNSLYDYFRAFFNQNSKNDAAPLTINNASVEEFSTTASFHVVQLLDYILNLEFLNKSLGVIITSGNFMEVTKLYGKMLILNVSETIISVSSITSVLALQFNAIGRFIAKLTIKPQPADQQAPNPNHQNPPENDLLNVGDVAAIFFFILSIQTGLSSLNGQLRIDRFFKNYSLLLIAILHYFHTSYDAQLIQLSASSKSNWKSQKHLRLLSVSSLLILIPLLVLVLLWRNFVVSTWFLAAIAFNIELIVKMCVTLIQYMLFMRDTQRITATTSADTKSEEQISDDLDQNIYYVKGFGHAVEFLIALFLFFNGVYILVFESYGSIRAIMICIHAYFHIWAQAVKGWSVFVKRRSAIEKLKSLKVFNTSTLHLTIHDEQDSEAYEKRLKDPCAICFSEIGAHEARITKCKHLFHSICLRKWLYIQDTCPMCHSIMYPSYDLN